MQSIKILNNLSLYPRYSSPNLRREIHLTIKLTPHTNKAPSPSPAESGRRDVRRIAARISPFRTTRQTHSDREGSPDSPPARENGMRHPFRNTRHRSGTRFL